MATASIICSIASFFFLPIIGAILGVVFGYTARRRIAEDPDLGGAELARAGIIIGWIAIGLTVLVIVLVIVLPFTLGRSNF